MTEEVNYGSAGEVTAELPKSGSKINYQFKLLYAIGILNVLIAHSHANAFAFLSEIIHFAGYTIALFVFVSGYFYNPKYESTIPSYLAKKFLKLIVPLYLWNLFYALLVVVLSKFGFTLVETVNLKSVLLSPMISAHLMGFNDPAWFIVPLFVTEVYNITVRRLLSKFNRGKTDFSLLVFHFLIGILGIYLAGKGYNKSWWLFLTRFMYFIPFYTLGYFYKNYLEKKDTLSNFWYLSIVLILALFIVLVYGHSSAYSIVVMDDNFFENPVVPYISGILGIAFYLRIARILTPAIGRSKAINLVADNTFPIMMNHIFGFFVLKLILMIAARVLPMLPDFSMEAFKSSLSYMYLPRGRGFPLVYILFGIAVPVLMQRGINIIKNLFCKFVKK